MLKCSVWPAIFTKAPNWPVGGEIDFVENVNLRTNNQYSLHTTQGCQHPANSSSSSNNNPTESGTLISTDCFNATANNEGCVVQDASTNSFGAGFNDNGGGVYAMLWDATGMEEEDSWVSSGMLVGKDWQVSAAATDKD